MVKNPKLSALEVMASIPQGPSYGSETPEMVKCPKCGNVFDAEANEAEGDNDAAESAPPAI